MVLVEDLFGKINVFDFFGGFIPWYFQKGFDVFHGDCRLGLSAHSFHLLLDFLFDLRRQIFRVYFFLQVRSVRLAHSSSQTERYSSFTEWRGLFSYLGHIVSNFFLDVDDGLDVFSLELEKLEKLLNFEVMLVHLKETEFLWQRQVNLISRLVNNFVDRLLSVNQLLFEIGLVKFKFAFIKDFHFFFEGLD